ncbi:hypothetical protein BDP27DRAFT_1367986 [Rhodocollybia butyracea]|uniref:Uncharacterized protein n=1 Tax=Rhodocollybia butyracea TaxID=206335 RepID=A0A9P5U3A9_9AGAR|nr:hypothetical protein BDP27DRAFT_1367986 [Rhodocollybia butyracea]
MSIFHRRQAIAEVAYAHDNLEAYANLSRFIFNNYRQALQILATRKTLARSMIEAGIHSEDFFKWLEEEGAYLQSLTKTRPSESLEMEYYLKLEALAACKTRLQQATSAWISYKPALELKLEISLRWKEGSVEWESAKKLVKEREYWKALDRLEGLLVSRIFEMSKLNVAGTAAIETYNNAALSLSPPRQTVSWDEIIEFSFLSEFDILRDAWDDVREKKWATQKNRLLMQQFFKLIGAESELECLHVEIQRLITSMEDEEAKFRSLTLKLKQTNPALALQIEKQGRVRSRFNKLHRQRFHAITKLEGFQPKDLVHFRRGTSVWSEDIVMLDEEDSSLGVAAGASSEPIEPEMLQADDEEAIENRVELLMYLAEDEA